MHSLHFLISFIKNNVINIYFLYTISAFLVNPKYITHLFSASVDVVYYNEAYFTVNYDDTQLLIFIHNTKVF